MRPRGTRLKLAVFAGHSSSSRQGELRLCPVPQVEQRIEPHGLDGERVRLLDGSSPQRRRKGIE
jgi:hypothetical protein